MGTTAWRQPGGDLAVGRRTRRVWVRHTVSFNRLGVVADRRLAWSNCVLRQSFKNTSYLQVEGCRQGGAAPCTNRPAMSPGASRADVFILQRCRYDVYSPAASSEEQQATGKQSHFSILVSSIAYPLSSCLPSPSKTVSTSSGGSILLRRMATGSSSSTPMARTVRSLRLARAWPSSGVSAQSKASLAAHSSWYGATC